MQIKIKLPPGCGPKSAHNHRFLRGTVSPDPLPDPPGAMHALRKIWAFRFCAGGSGIPPRSPFRKLPEPATNQRNKPRNQKVLIAARPSPQRRTDGAENNTQIARSTEDRRALRADFARTPVVNRRAKDDNTPTANLGAHGPSVREALPNLGGTAFSTRQTGAHRLKTLTHHKWSNRWSGEGRSMPMTT